MTNQPVSLNDSAYDAALEAVYQYRSNTPVDNYTLKDEYAVFLETYKQADTNVGQVSQVSDTSSTLIDCRAAFEEYAIRIHLDTDEENGRYCSPRTSFQWDGWQACWNLQQREMIDNDTLHKNVESKIMEGLTLHDTDREPWIGGTDTAANLVLRYLQPYLHPPKREIVEEEPKYMGYDALTPAQKMAYRIGYDRGCADTKDTLVEGQ